MARAACLVLVPIWLRGAPIGHDSQYHYLWAAQFAESLAAGIGYPRWLPDVNGGLGNPTFVFYSPLLYYVAAAPGRFAPVVEPPWPSPQPSGASHTRHGASQARRRTRTSGAQ